MYNVCLIPGDGIGLEVIPAARQVLEALGIAFQFTSAEAGFACYQKLGDPLPGVTVEACRSADAVLFGSVTTPPNMVGYKSAIVSLRRELDLYANVRPTISLPIPGARPQLDLVIVRENTEDLYGGDEDYGDERAVTRRIITRAASQRIVEFAYQLAQTQQKRKVTIVHKANVMRATCGLFLKVALEVASRYPDIQTETMLVDAMAMHLVKDPQKFEVIVTTNMFGDILSDEASALSGGLGLAASANIGVSHALFEPVHGSAPDIAGQGIANPLAAILAAGMMLDHLQEHQAAERVKQAVVQTLRDQVFTPDLGGSATTDQVTRAVIKNLG